MEDESDKCDGCGEIYTGTEKMCEGCRYVYCGNCLEDGCPHCGRKGTPDA